MKNWTATTLQETQACLSALSTGRFFVDHLGQQVTRESEVCVSVGPGYNNLFTVGEYLDLVTYGDLYGSYVLHPWN